MEYHFQGIDHIGRLHYIPTKTPKSSWFSQFFAFEDGVISLSLKSLTIWMSLILSLTLILELFQTCLAGTFECSIHDFPMISTVVRQEMYDRIFILQTSVYMFGVQQVNLRAFYKKLYGLIPDQQNDLMLCLGLVTCFSLVLIGIFDEKMWSQIHGVIAGAFFVSFGLYAYLLGRSLKANIDRFPASQHKAINKLYNASSWVMVGLVVFLTSVYLVKSDTPTPFFEWVVVLYFLNFFALTGLDNEFYESVHQPPAK